MPAKKVAAKAAKAAAKLQAAAGKDAGTKSGATKAAPEKPVKAAKPPPKPVDLPDFSDGDFVVYPTHGVGRVEGIERQTIAGHDLQLIVIHFEQDRMTLRVPITKAKEAGLRRLSSRDRIREALTTLKGRARVKRTMWSRRAQEYEAKINSGDPVAIAEVVRDLFRNTNQPDQSYSERQIYQSALDRLARELAAIEQIDEVEAAERLESVMRKAA